MKKGSAVIKWSELYKLAVYVPSEGKSLGHVEDFFFQEGTNAVYALRVRTRLHGDLTLPVTGITSIDEKRVNIENAQMLARAVPPFDLGQKLLARKVVTESGKDHGSVKDVLLGIEPIVAMRVAGLEYVHGPSDRGSHTVGADAIARYHDDAVIIYDQFAKSLR